jgi:hypothetical protein
MSMSYFQPVSEHVLEWVILLSTAAAWLCALALAMMMVVDRWRLALHQRQEKTRRSASHDDVLDLNTSPHQASWAADSDYRSSGQRTDTA